MNAAAFCLAYAGFTGLSMAMDRHFEDVFDREPTPAVRNTLRMAGSLALLASLLLCAYIAGWSYGTVLWIGMLTASGLLLIWIMTFYPRVAWSAGAACVLLAPVLSALRV